MPRLLRPVRENGRTVWREAARLRPSALSAQISLFPLSRAEMTLERGDTEVNVRDYVRIDGQNGMLGVFRVSYISTDGFGRRNVRLDHALCALGDAAVTGEEPFDGTVRQALERILAAQQGEICWRLGEVQDEGAYAAENRFDNALQCLTDLARREDGYYFDFDWSDFPWTLRFLRKSDAVATEFRLSRNADNCRITLDDSGLCTRLYLAVEDGDTEPVYEIYDDTAAQARWGIVSRALRLNAGEAPDRAAWARAYFDRHARPGLQIEIDGAELNRLTGERLDRVRLGGVCRAALPEYGAVFDERILTVRYPDLVRHPDRVTVLMAEKPADGASPFAALGRRTSAAERALIKERVEIRENKTRWIATDRHLTEQGEILHAAGIELDPHGVWLFAKEEGALGTMHADLRVQAGQISAKADSTTVNALGARVSSVELDLDGDAGTIGLKARVQSAEGNIRQAQIDIDGAESAIRLKADTVTVDAVRTEISNLKTGVTTASFLKASTMSCSSFYFGGYTVGTRNVNINGTLYTLLVGFD